MCVGYTSIEILKVRTRIEILGSENLYTCLEKEKGNLLFDSSVHSIWQL